MEEKRICESHKRFQPCKLRPRKRMLFMKYKFLGAHLHSTGNEGATGQSNSEDTPCLQKSHLEGGNS